MKRSYPTDYRALKAGMRDAVRVSERPNQACAGYVARLNGDKTAKINQGSAEFSTRSRQMEIIKRISIALGHLFDESAAGGTTVDDAIASILPPAARIKAVPRASPSYARTRPHTNTLVPLALLQFQSSPASTKQAPDLTQSLCRQVRASEGTCSPCLGDAALVILSHSRLAAADMSSLPTAATATLPIRLRRRISSPSSSTRMLRKEQLQDAARARPRHRLSSATSSPNLSSINTQSSQDSAFWSESSNSSDSEAPLTPATDAVPDHFAADLAKTAEVDVTQDPSNGVRTTLVTQDPSLLNEVVGDGETGTQLIQKYCCGGGCCFLNAPKPAPAGSAFTPLDLPDNDAFKSLGLKLDNLNQETELTNITEYPAPFVSIEPTKTAHTSTVTQHPPTFVQPHPPYNVFSAPVYHARELTKPGAEKRTFHFDIDVTDYPEEAGVDFKVGGAVGVCPPNNAGCVDEVFDMLGVPRFLRDKPITLNTTNTRWPTIWGDETSRALTTTRRELLTWCSDIQSYPPTKALFRLLAEHATDPNEKKILFYLASAQGQSSFCELRTGPHLALTQLLHAFPSSKPPLPDLFSTLQQLTPRFYSLSNDPHVSSEREGLVGRRLIEIAVTVHETPSWRGRPRTGVGSGYMERLALAYADAKAAGKPAPDLRVPLFRGLMSNPLSKEFGVSDGPMMLIGAGVGMAPFRGFILNRLRNANCASKIWLVQGVRNSDLDELYSGELGKYESQIKRVVQSRAGSRKQSPAPKTPVDRLKASAAAANGLLRSASESDLALLERAEVAADAAVEADAAAVMAAAHEKWKASQSEARYVQDELRQQADVVWDIIRSVDGRIFVCGSSKGMGEGVEEALVEVAMEKGGHSREGAEHFWKEMKDSNKYVAERLAGVAAFGACRLFDFGLWFPLV
ncbi:hypothetical protein FH972_025068 [Carpinus fangiana]|uniref:FAD-binding FR-type domain-containing protein n=1 Tax=Carpinus fangiana TaxID=176857 RepID=A0A5N6KZZ0_9ROSI|nr:hypothetical protein FH972_025068 [Carpinus fangiana]